MNEKLPILRKKAMSLPLTPGVYLMKNIRNEIIYVGKAKALKNRVSQYFGSQNNHTEKVKKMVENVNDFDYIMCDSEFEALVLECSLIKQHNPKYNILLKDDKGYSYIRVREGNWLDFSAVFKVEKDDARYLGPYMSSYSVTNIVDTAKKLFRLPQCSKRFPQEYGKGKPCLNYSIGLCNAPCAGKISISDHNENVRKALEFIEKGSDEILNRLTEEMNTAAENLEFEKAAKLRDQIKSIHKVSDKQKVVATSYREQDVFAIVEARQENSVKSCLSVLRFRDYRLYDSEHFIIDSPEDMPSARHEILRSYYSMRDFVPARVSIDGEVAENDLLEEWLSSLKGKKVSVILPQKGEQHSLIEMCRSNAAQKLAIYLGRGGKATAALDELGTLLGLDSPPQYIESYDISHTAGSNNVAGMVVFKNGLPYKKAYKKFTIKGFSGQDDYASMAEVIDRRLNEYEASENHDEGFGRLPDLILLDGGKGQVNAVIPVLEKHGITIPLFGMVKDSHHRTRAIACSGDELSLTSKRSAFTLVSTIQEEVHRYSVSFHHQKSKNASLSSTLTSINGIGEKRAKSLMKYFKTVKAIASAGIDEIAKAPGMSVKSAKSVYDALHPDSE